MNGNDTRAQKRIPSGRLALFGLAFVLLAAIVLPRFRGAARYEVSGTITQIDLNAGRATLEYIDPANGSTREVGGEVPATCRIIINGRSATLAELRPGDAVVARALIERNKGDKDRETRVVAEELQVTRSPRGNP